MTTAHTITTEHMERAPQTLVRCTCGWSATHNVHGAQALAAQHLASVPADHEADQAEHRAWVVAKSAGDTAAVRDLAKAAQDAAQARGPWAASSYWVAAGQRWRSAAELATQDGDHRHAVHWYQRAAWCWDQAAEHVALGRSGAWCQDRAQELQQAADALRPLADAQQAAEMEAAR